MKGDRNRPSGAWRRRTGRAAMSGPTGMTRRRFLGTTAAGVGAAMIGASGIGFAHPGSTGDWKHPIEEEHHGHCIVDLAGTPWVSAECLYHGGHSPIDVYKRNAAGELTSEVAHTYWIRERGDAILVPTALSPFDPITYEPATGFDGQLWSTDPVEGFTKPKGLEYLQKGYGDHFIWVKSSGAKMPLHVFTKIVGAFGMSGFNMYNRQILPPESITQMVRPGSVKDDGTLVFAGEEIAEDPDFDKNVYNVEFIVPASAAVEAHKPFVKQFLLGYLINNLGKTLPEAIAILQGVSPDLFRPTQTEHKIRGWFAKGDPDKPLVIMTSKHHWSFTHRDDLPYVLGSQKSPPVGPTPTPKMPTNLDKSVMKHPRSLMYYLNKWLGYNVLMWDRIGVGNTKGYCQMADFTPAGVKMAKDPYGFGPTGPTWEPRNLGEVIDEYPTGNVPSVFYMLHQLTGESYPAETGHNMNWYNPDEGTGTSALLDREPEDIPVITIGTSHASWIAMWAAQRMCEDKMETDEEGYPIHGGWFKDHNIRGVVEISGLGGTMAYTCDYNTLPQFYWMMSIFGMPFIWNLTSFAGGAEILAKAPNYWAPGTATTDGIAYLGIKAFSDSMGTPDCTINFFNSLNTNKDITMVYGDHFAPHLAPNDTYVTMKILNFCRQADMSGFLGYNNPTRTTTLYAEIGKAPRVDLQAMYDYYYAGTGSEPDGIGKLHVAENTMKKLSDPELWDSIQ